VAAVKVAWAAHLSALFHTPTGVVMPLGVGETSATTTTETRFLDPQACPFTGHRAASSCVRSTAFRTTRNRLFLSEQQFAASVNNGSHSTDDDESAEDIDDDLCQ
jgi:hypothetical protein